MLQVNLTSGDGSWRIAYRHFSCIYWVAHHFKVLCFSNIFRKFCLKSRLLFHQKLPLKCNKVSEYDDLSSQLDLCRCLWIVPLLFFYPTFRKKEVDHSKRVHDQKPWGSPCFLVQCKIITMWCIVHRSTYYEPILKWEPFKCRQLIY